MSFSFQGVHSGAAAAAIDGAGAGADDEAEAEEEEVAVVVVVVVVAVAVDAAVGAFVDDTVSSFASSSGRLMVCKIIKSSELLGILDDVVVADDADDDDNVVGLFPTTGSVSAAMGISRSWIACSALVAQLMLLGKGSISDRSIGRGSEFAAAAGAEMVAAAAAGIVEVVVTAAAAAAVAAVAAVDDEDDDGA